MRGTAILILLAAGALVFSIPLLAGSWTQNSVDVGATKALFAAPAASSAPAQARSPAEAYALGLLALKRGSGSEAEKLLQQALTADTRYLSLVRLQVPMSVALAQLAVQTYPRQYIAWDWMGDNDTDFNEALSDYQHAVALQPRANLVWEKIGALAEKAGQPDLALNAYERACNINPRRNGSCLNAARLAGAAGDSTTANEYYGLGSNP